MSGIARTAAVVVACSAVAQVLRPTLATAQTTLLEVAEDDGPDAFRFLHVNDDGGLVARGRENVGVIPTAGPGPRLMWYPRKFAFRVGNASASEWDDANIGFGSVAMGQSTTANRFNSTAMGNSTTASGDNSTALGHLTTASNGGSTAMGHRTTASGPYSTAMGFITTASNESSTAMGKETKATGGGSTAMGFATTAGGHASTAMGERTTASGTNSTAMGFRTTAAGAQTTALGSNAVAFGKGSFAYGDASTDAVVSALVDEFVVRAAGGFRFRTSPTLNTGCDLPAGSGAFNCTSSRLAKEGFEDVDGETVLGKLAAMSIQRWRYRGTASFHVGPTAEDFHAAFELGEGPTTISTVDADGISLVAVQALERRTTELREENARLRTELEAVLAMVHQLSAARVER